MNEFAATGVDPASVNAAELGEGGRAARGDSRGGVHEALAASGDARLLGRPLPRRGLDLGRVGARAGDRRGSSRANPGQVEAYRGGKEGLLGFFVGQVMKETGGKANPKVVNERLREKLQG